jgi:tRNA threonylcarbamoyladenosine biosynthesis protein TsaB
MILLIDTSTPDCRLTLIDGEQRFDDVWTADRTLADKLLGYLRGQLQAHGKTWSDITGIGVFKGPGSFTGLRIGLTVMNTLADSLDIPIIGETDEDWQQKALKRLDEGQNDRLVMPLYGREANITKPRK